MADTTPTNSPFVLMTGPPLFPGRAVQSKKVMSPFNLETIPSVMRFVIPNGLPIIAILSPTVTVGATSKKGVGALPI